MDIKDIALPIYDFLLQAIAKHKSEFRGPPPRRIVLPQAGVADLMGTKHAYPLLTFDPCERKIFLCGVEIVASFSHTPPHMIKFDGSIEEL